VINNGVGVNYKIHINSRDTNGTIQKYIWNFNSTIDSSAQFVTTDSQYTKIFTQIEMNQAQNIWIYGRDDDGLLRGGEFVFFADSAPPEPSLGSPGISGDSVQFVWQNADAKDGDSTQFQILFDTSNPPTTVVKPFGTCKKLGGLFYYWYHPAASGIYRFKVIARDARGTTSPSQVSSFFSFTKP
jgi:hypothetical protein